MKSLSLDVKEFSERAASLVSNYHHDFFSISMDYACTEELGSDSPIEHIFYIAFSALCNIHNLIQDSGRTVDVNPQKKILSYRVDFECVVINREEFKTFKQCVVECDGHDFHDRNEKQRRYEKIRDRKLQAGGWRVFHFTGSEIKEKPFECAAEVVSFLTGWNVEVILDPIQAMRA